MGENFKNRIILLLLASVIIFSIATIGSCGHANRQRVAREQELAARLDMEEEINKSIQEKAAIEEHLARIQKELEEEKSAHQATKEDLEQQQVQVESLKIDLKKMTKIKEQLEEDLKEVLVSAELDRDKR